jgi:dUTP pyrophosphatase
MRCFKKISLKQYIKDGGTEEEYNSIVLPIRATKFSSGYDICTPRRIIISKGESVKVPTGIRVFMENDEVFMMHIRSSIGSKFGVRVSNCTGVVDSDYIAADNQGHIWMFLHNDSEHFFEIQAGSKICQGVFHKYLITDDDTADAVRTGGVGSTGK